MGLKINVDINNLSTDCNKMTDLISELKNLTQKITDEVAEFNGMSIDYLGYKIGRAHV